MNAPCSKCGKETVITEYPDPVTENTRVTIGPCSCRALIMCARCFREKEALYEKTKEAL